VFGNMAPSHLQLTANWRRIFPWTICSQLHFRWEDWTQFYADMWTACHGMRGILICS